MSASEQNLIVCPSCGARFDRSLPECPYCGSTNPEGAEKEYMEDLGELKEDLQDLTEEGIGTASKELRKHGRFLRKTLLIVTAVALSLCGLFFYTEYRDEKKAEADFLWRRENYPRMDEIYESGDYRALAEFYVENGAEGNPVWSYAHAGLCEVVLSMQTLDSFYEEEKGGRVPDSQDLEWILTDELTILYAEYQEHLTKEDRKWIEDNAGPYLDDFRTRFDMDGATMERFRQIAEDMGGYADRALVKEYIGQMTKR